MRSGWTATAISNRRIIYRFQSALLYPVVISRAIVTRRRKFKKPTSFRRLIRSFRQRRMCVPPHFAYSRILEKLQTRIINQPSLSDYDFVWRTFINRAVYICCGNIFFIIPKRSSLFPNWRKSGYQFWPNAVFPRHCHSLFRYMKQHCYWHCFNPCVIWRSKKTLSLHNISLNFYIIYIYISISSVLRENGCFNKFQTLF